MKARKVLLTLAAAAAVFAVAGVALAGDGAPANEYLMKAAMAVAAGFGVGIGAFGAALAQGRLASAALEGIARNPGAQEKIFTPLLLSLAFPESLLIFTWVICFLIQNRL